MRAVLCREAAGIDRLEIADLPEPEPGACGVRIRVTAAGINFADTLMVAGQYQERPPLPFVPGLEVAGTVDSLGAAISSFAPGQRVLALVDRGGFAEKVLAREDDVVPLPDDVEDIAAAGFAIVYGTAYGALCWRAQMLAGETLLVHGAAGGVGLAAVECGKALGARVIATARGPEKVAIAREHGADLAIDSEDPDLVARIKENTNGRGADVALDPVGGRMFDASLRCIAWEGRIVLVGFASGVIPQIPANRLLVKNAAALGFYWGSYRKFDPARIRDAFDTLFEWHTLGRIRPHVSHVLPLDQVRDALRLLVERRSSGKVVLKV